MHKRFKVSPVIVIPLLRLLTFSLVLANISWGCAAHAQPSYGEIPDYQLQTDVPTSTVIPYEQVGRHRIVEASINDHPIKMVFDTGASGTVVGKNHLEALGIEPPKGESDSTAKGVGQSDDQEKNTKTWYMIVDLQVGGIRFRKFRIHVMEYLPTDPLLGRSFSQEFKNTIDTEAKTITLAKKVAPTNASYRSATSLPFKNIGNQLVVQGSINSSPCSMIFDTGASLTLFTADQFRALGLTVPYDAKEIVVGGISGSSKAKRVYIPMIQLGPIIKNDFPVYVTEKGDIDFPLVGQDFFGEWNCAIDQANQQIDFQMR